MDSSSSAPFQVDPVSFGELRQTVSAHTDLLTQISVDVKALLEQKNRTSGFLLALKYIGILAACLLSGGAGGWIGRFLEHAL